MLHKPLGKDDAAAQLAFLSGKTHQLFSAVAVVFNDQIVASLIGTARLTMRSLSPSMIERYLEAAGDAVGESVGGYQLERVGVHLFSRVLGDHTTILGLPMLQTLAQLRQLGLVAE
jgi:septum formation protein